MPKILEFSSDARRSLERGVDTLANVVRVTIGPNGRNVVLDKKFGAPTITNDGVTIAKEVALEDPHEDLGAALAKEVATKTNDVAGDGTTTATVIAQAMVHEGLRQVTAGASPTALKAGIEKAVARVAEELAAQAVDIDGQAEMAHVASISAQDRAIGELIAESMHRVGKDGVITVEESSTMGLELEFTDGMQIDKGYISPYMITDQEAQEAVLEEPYILLHQGKISAIADLLPVLELIAEAKKPLLIIAEDVEGEALSTLVVNRVRGTLVTVAVKAPAFGDRRKAILQDLAIVTAAQVVSPEVGLRLDRVTLEDLGRARRVVVDKDSTTVVDGGGDKAEIEDRKEQIRAEIDRVDSDWDRSKLRERLARLAGGVGVIKVGAATEVELRERKHRIEDAVSATRAAVEEGIVAGGGSALVRAALALADGLGEQGDVATGVAVVRRSLDAPLRWIATNAGYHGGVVVQRVRELPDRHGFNAATGEYEDLVTAGVIDPVKVTRSAVENAASVVGLLLTTEALVADKPAPKEGDGHSHGHSHGHGHSH